MTSTKNDLRFGLKLARAGRVPRFALAVLLAGCALLPFGRAQERTSHDSGRERSGLAEDQALLLRQLTRLKQTMEILAAKYETEGRTHAAELLREGLKHLGARADGQGAKTLEELM